MTAKERKYILKLVDKDLKIANINYESVVMREQIDLKAVLNLSTKRFAREFIKRLVISYFEAEDEENGQ